MQALRITTNFGSFRKKSLQSHKIARNQLHNLLVLLFPRAFIFNIFFTTLNFQKKLQKSKCIILTFYFITLIFKFNRFKISFQVVFDNFSADR